MKAALVIFLLMSYGLAQNNTTSIAQAPGCGPTEAKFAVKTDKGQHPITQPNDGKAMVYFVEDDSHFESLPKPTTRIGVDGSWVGANHGNSYFYFSVDPGPHHLCASWQSTVVLGAGRKAAAAHFTAEAGGVYYFRVKNSWLREHGVADIELVPLDGDEGQLLASKFAFSTFQPKE
jgi:uncharacterized protein DUF2846